MPTPVLYFENDPRAHLTAANPAHELSVAVLDETTVDGYAGAFWRPVRSAGWLVAAHGLTAAEIAALEAIAGESWATRAEFTEHLNLASNESIIGPRIAGE